MSLPASAKACFQVLIPRAFRYPLSSRLMAYPMINADVSSRFFPFGASVSGLICWWVIYVVTTDATGRQAKWNLEHSKANLSQSIEPLIF